MPPFASVHMFFVSRDGPRCLLIQKYLSKFATTVEPRFNDLRYNDIPGITINLRLPSKSYSKMYGAEPRYNDLRYNDITGLTMGISQTTGTPYELYILFLTCFKDIEEYSGCCNSFDDQLQIY